jgi:hypothetical protein
MCQHSRQRAQCKQCTVRVTSAKRRSRMLFKL